MKKLFFILAVLFSLNMYAQQPSNIEIHAFSYCIEDLLNTNNVECIARNSNDSLYISYTDSCSNYGSVTDLSMFLTAIMFRFPPIYYEVSFSGEGNIFRAYYNIDVQGERYDVAIYFIMDEGQCVSSVIFR